VFVDLSSAHGRTDMEATRILRDPGQFSDFLYVDHQIGLAQSGRHLDHQIGTSGQHMRDFPSDLRQSAHSLGDRARCDVLQAILSQCGDDARPGAHFGRNVIQLTSRIKANTTALGHSKAIPMTCLGDANGPSLGSGRGRHQSRQIFVFFAIAFLSQTNSGPVRNAIDKLMKSQLFSYGISDKPGKLELYKPDKSMRLVDFAYLAKITPKPFNKEWSGGKGIHEHDKFVVTDFNLLTAQVFTGSSNLPPSGEEDNGDNLVIIKDQKVATSYAIEASGYSITCISACACRKHSPVRAAKGAAARRQNRR